MPVNVPTYYSHKNLSQISRQATVLDLRVLTQKTSVTLIELSTVWAVVLHCTKCLHICLSSVNLHDDQKLSFHLKKQLYFPPSITCTPQPHVKIIQKHFMNSMRILCGAVPIVLNTHMLSINASTESNIYSGFNIYTQPIFYVKVPCLKKSA